MMSRPLAGPLCRARQGGPAGRSLLPQRPLAFSLLDLLQQGLDVAWQGLPQGILVDPFEIPTDA
ncbi:MAG: hypothetical protein K0R61_380 [Microvirga sp.]|jgi:hypothetical protein|nr:hypothetical protein [Microvirga sp.]MDF2969930.1 hypothetical protein [Microvirga sp.]